MEPENLPPVLQKLTKKGALNVLRKFSTEVPGLTGYVVKHQGQAEIVYGIHGDLIVGQLISGEGEDLTKTYGAKYLPKPDYGAIVKSVVKGGHLISEGSKKAPTLYAIVDPDCIFCYHLFQATRSEVKAGKLHMEWVLVGFLKSSSAARATAILAADDPLHALQRNYNKFDVKNEEGGMPPDQKTPADIAALLKAHFQAMQSAGSNGTPTVLYRKADKKWGMHMGLPPEKWLKAFEAGKLASG